jgi:hypothetical protein
MSCKKQPRTCTLRQISRWPSAIESVAWETVQGPGSTHHDFPCAHKAFRERAYVSDARKGRGGGGRVEKRAAFGAHARCAAQGPRAMAAATAPSGVSLQEATQRKLRRFSQLRGTKGGTQVSWAVEREGASRAWRFAALSLPVCYYLQA